MVLRFGSCKITPVVILDLYFYKCIPIGSTLSVFLLDSKTNKLVGQKKGILIPNYRNILDSIPTSTLTKFI